MLKKTIYIISAFLLFLIGIFLLKSDMIPFVQWWLAVLCLGIIFIPLSSKLFSDFLDKGYLFTKAIGIAVSGYIMWLLSSLHLMKFNTVSCMICILICIILNAAILLYGNKKNGTANKQYSKKAGIRAIHTETIDFILLEEVLFFGLFLIFLYIRGFKPEAYGTEKFMDYGFMTSMMRSDYMPPQDFWFAGTNLNYYYVGQYMATFMTKLALVKVSDGYNLMLMMVGAFAFILPFSLVLNLTAKYMEERANNRRIIPVISGLIAGAGVCIAGNMHYPVFKWFEPGVRKFFGMEKGTYKYWFPDATRYIGYHPDTHDKTIHEFPCYSFVLGDLHAHVINILFVITVLGILFAWLYSRKKITDEKPQVWKEIFHPALIMLGFFIGLFHTTNFWDFPIYYVVCGAVILFSNMIVYNFKGKAVWLTALQGIFMMAFSYLVTLPFTINFDQISTTPRLCVNHTPLNQLIVLWGLPIFVVVAFLCFMASDYKKWWKKEGKHQQGEKKSKLFCFMEYLHSSDLFIITVGLCAIGLILMPEVIYIQDIYSGDYKRANTMFKLTYQAFIMFGLCFGYIFPRLLKYGNTKRQKIVATVSLVFFAMTMCYAGNAVHAWYGNIFHPENYKGINCTSFMETQMPDDYLAMNWINENISGTPVVLEANGDSYTDYERISVMTGLPTVLGWRTHEWLWKSNTDVLDARAADIQTIYTSEDEAKVRSLIKKYNISYIYVGKLEQEKFTDLNHQLLNSLGSLVFESPMNENKHYGTYIIKVKKQ